VVLLKKIDKNQLRDLHFDPNRGCKNELVVFIRGKMLVLLPNGNARPYTSAATAVAVESIGFEVVPRPPFCPDLARTDFWLFVIPEKSPAQFI
jgi:transposase